MSFTVQEFCFYSLVPQIPIFILVATAYTCQLKGNIRTAIYNRQTLNMNLQYCDQSFGFKIVLNDENSLLLLAFVTVKESNKESEIFFSPLQYYEVDCMPCWLYVFSLSGKYWWRPSWLRCCFFDLCQVMVRILQIVPAEILYHFTQENQQQVFYSNLLVVHQCIAQRAMTQEAIM